MKILIATYPFGSIDPSVRDMLVKDGNILIENPYQRRLKAGEVGRLIQDCDAVIAGTEPYTKNELEQCDGKLQLISRVGIGLDSVDLAYCKKKGIRVAYTPDAPSQAVAELTIHHMLALCRGTIQSHNSVIDLSWHRQIGFLLRERKIGVLGVGRIGKKVVKILQAFEADIRVCDIEPDEEFFKENNLKNYTAEELFSECDLITIHIPLNEENYQFVKADFLQRMPKESFIINTSRGPVLDEHDLLSAYNSGIVTKGALDVFSTEPYMGPLLKKNNDFIFSAHIGASARESRRDMEMEAAKAVLAFKHSEMWQNYVV